GAGSADPRAHAARHSQRARRQRIADIQRSEKTVADDGRQSERPCPQARGGGVRAVHQIVRGTRTEDGVHDHRHRTAGSRALPRSHGSDHPRDSRPLEHAARKPDGPPTPVTFDPLPRPIHMQRTTAIPSAYSGIHVGIIMDGNGRWAAARGMPRTAGHRGGVRTLTLYAFSSDNWTRPTPEVSALMRLLGRSLILEGKRCVDNGVRLTI